MIMNMDVEYAAPLIPVLLFAVYSLVFSHAIDLPPKQRISMAPLLLAAFAGSFWTMNHIDIVPGLGINYLWGMGLTVHLAHTFSLLYIEQTTVEETIPKGSDISRAVAKYRLWEDPQRLYRKRDGSVERASRSEVLIFLLKRSLRLLALWLIHTYIVNAIFPGLFLPLGLKHFSPERRSFIRRLFQTVIGGVKDRVGVHETMLRFALTGYWLWTVFATLSGVNTILSMGFVALGLDNPSDWPHIFGSLAEASTIRRFWSKYWHRITVPPYSVYSRLIVQSVGLKPNSRSGKMATAFGIFAISGGIHAICSWNTGDRCGAADDLWFYVANFFAAAVETFFMGQAWSWLEGGWLSRHRMASRVLGYLWVGGFLFWSVPKWQYPKLYCSIKDAIAAASA